MYLCTKIRSKLMPPKSIKTVFTPGIVKGLDYPSPYFLLDKTELLRSLGSYEASFPGAEIYYAMKSNSEPEVLRIVSEHGSGFEVASTYELKLLKAINVPPEKILYGTAVKPADHIKDFVAYGVDRFAFDSEQELEKLAEQAPGSKVYVRALVNDQADSVFTMSEKFGIDPSGVFDLMTSAKNHGLVPYGISFNVGSQARNAAAWANGILNLIPVIEKLNEAGIRLEVINLGGGFPTSYLEGDGFPAIEQVGEHTQVALQKLPYPMKVFIEPGRGIVASCMALVTTVIAKNKRDNGHWLFLDAGAYNALLEAMFIQGDTRYRTTTVDDFGDASQESYILTGPTGDSLDVISTDTKLPSSIKVGDRLVVHDTGAYSTVLATPFNGFPRPPLHIL
jgi:ornithine decarboxylase